MFSKIWCWIVGHNMISLYSITNEHLIGHRAGSYWGEHKCMRCGKSEHWQWDF